MVKDGASPMTAESWYFFKELHELITENPKLKDEVQHGRDTGCLFADGKFPQILEPQVKIKKSFCFCFQGGKVEIWGGLKYIKYLFFHQSWTDSGALKGIVFNLAYSIVLTGIFVKFKSVNFSAKFKLCQKWTRTANCSKLCYLHFSYI